MPKTVLRPKNLEFQPRPSYPYSPGAEGAGTSSLPPARWPGTRAAKSPTWASVRAQTLQTLNNVISVLAEGGAGLDDVVKCNVYLKDMGDFQAMNEVFARFFPDQPPARTTVQAALAEHDMLVEIEAIAYVA